MPTTIQKLLSAFTGRPRVVFGALLIMAASAAQASQITFTCSDIVSLTPPSSGSGNANCAGFTGVNALPVGATINYVKMTYGVDFMFDQFQLGTPTVTFSFNAPGTLFDVASFQSNQPNRPVFGTTQAAGPSALSGLTGPFSVTGSWNAGVPPITGVSMNVEFTADYTLVPEPITTGLLGISLLGLGFLRRRS